MRAFGNIMHECSHNIFFVAPKYNQFLGHLIAILLFECFDTYKKEHLFHHRFLGHRFKDPEYLKYKKIKLNFFHKNNLNIFISIFNPYHWYLSLKNSSFFRSKNKLVAKLKILYLFFLFLLSYFYWKIFLIYFLIPYLTSYQILKLFSDIVDHDKIYEKIIFTERSRNHIFKWKILNWCIFPRNDAYHLLHHLYPKLPVSKYPSHHALLLKKNSTYASGNHSCDLQKF